MVVTHTGYTVAYSDAADIFGLKGLNLKYRNDNIEASMCNADDFGTISVEVGSIALKGRGIT